MCWRPSLKAAHIQKGLSTSSFAPKWGAPYVIIDAIIVANFSF